MLDSFVRSFVPYLVCGEQCDGEVGDQHRDAVIEHPQNKYGMHAFGQDQGYQHGIRHLPAQSIEVEHSRYRTQVDEGEYPLSCSK